MHPPNDPLDLTSAKTHHQEGNWAEAETAYKKALEQDPKNAEALALLGVLSCQLGKFDQGVGYLKKATLCDPESPTTYYNLGKALDGNGLLEDALVAYQSAAKIKDDYADAWNNIGDCLTRLGRNEESVEAYQKAVKLNPSSHVYFNLGNALLEKGDLVQASQRYQEALNLEPEFAEAALNLAIVFKRQGDFSVAKSWCSQALDICPDYVKGLNEMAILCNQTGESEEAIELYKRVLSLEPDNSIAKHLLDSLLGNDSEKASPSYVEELFDQYANRFETHLAESLQYKTPATLHSMAKKNLSDDFRVSNMLDLGCGTGLCGSLFKSHCEKLYGVDISTKMIQQAHGKEIYDELKAQEIIEYLAQTETKFDLFVAADVFVYLGNLEPVFKAVSVVAKNGACFVFSTETTDKDFVLKLSGRFGHSKEYVETIASKFHWTLEDVQSDILRVENAQNVSGNLFFFRWKS
jgi:predicted TPR repeat methyltransferase